MAMISAVFIIILASFGICLSLFISQVGEIQVKMVASAASPFFLLYLIFGLIGIVIASINFFVQKERLLAIINIGLYGFILFFTIVFSFLNMPLIIESGVYVPIYTFATTFSLFFIASILGVVAGIIKITH
jgi:hypothetical protein